MHRLFATGFISPATEAGNLNCINLHKPICATRQTKKMRLTGRRIFYHERKLQFLIPEA
jgi:hypothetical protein